MSKGERKKLKKKVKLAADIDSNIFLRGTGYHKKIRGVAKINSVKDLTGSDQSEDVDIYNAANSQGIHILTANDKDYKRFPQGKKSNVGVISYPQMADKSVLANLYKFIRESGHDELYGRSVYVSKDGVTDRGFSKKKKQFKKFAD